MGMYTAVKVSEEIYAFYINTAVGKMVLQRFYDLLGSLSKECEIVFKTIRALM